VITLIAQIVRFKSGLSGERVLEMFEARSARYREVKGLVQKYYLRFSELEEYGAVYLWESADAMTEFRESELGRSIRQTYEIQGESDVRVGDVVLVLRP
jgi:heme-degrading monooxygenase HmoA